MTALFGKADAAWFDALRREHYPPERNHVPAHLTMFHHLAPALETELKRRLAQETRGIAPPPARLAGLVSLGQGVAFRIESPGLADIRDRLADAFATMLMPQDKAALAAARHGAEQGAAGRRQGAAGRRWRPGFGRARWRSAASPHGGIEAAHGRRCRAICSRVDRARGAAYSARLAGGAPRWRSSSAG